AEEFLALFKERMAGDITCKAILGQDSSKPEGLAVIRKEGLMLKLCPRAMRVCIAIVEEMIADYHTRKNDFSKVDTVETDDLTTIIKHADKRRRFTGSVAKLLDSTDKKVAFIQFDIKRFKIINDLYGEKFGDEVLFFISEKLKTICSENQFFMNVRADVFIIVTEYETDDELDDIIARLEEDLEEFKEVKLQLSFGVYTVEDREMEIRQMEDRAAMARKAAKKEVVTNRLFYQEQFKELLYTRKFIEENMHSAINEKQFKMYLQPKYSISQNKIVGAEALVRWIHPQRGMVYPNEFIPIFEENGFIRMVDYYIWEEACHFIKKCTGLGIKDCPVSVNVSRQHLKDMEFMRVLVAYIRNNAIDKSLLELEITETANDEKISKVAEQLKEDGFTLLMDDFGSGYSSLTVLLETHFDVLKLHKKFMDNMMASD
ncbi:MAG: GGDEF domain-containing phosphodiesterase, partial [Lachnospiraceae bacterium]|nr:GGDEF domain-containing phosphodiesterase [Lachnospiraceae bacterium]